MKPVRQSELSHIIYKIYNFLHNELTDSKKLIGFIIAISAAGLAISKKEFRSPALATFIVLLSVLLFYLILRMTISRVLKNIGSEGRFIFSGNYLNNKGNRLFKINTNEINKDKFIFAAEEDASLTANLNIEAYKKSVWGTNFKEKYDRNLSHIKKNKLSILLIKAIEGDEFIGFSHILAVNKQIWDKYISGNINDNQFADTYIIPEIKKHKDHEAYGLILFSIAVAKHPEKRDTFYWEKIGDYLEQAIAVHIESYIESESFKNEKTTIPILFQNMDMSFVKFFKDKSMSIAGISKDGARIITFEIAND